MTDREYISLPDLGYSVTKRQLVCRDDNFRCDIHFTRLEDGREMAFVHLDVVEMTPRVLRQLDRSFKEHRGTVADMLFAVFDDGVGHETPARDRLARRFGFERISEMPGRGGSTCGLYLHINTPN